jgi:hypothetical protein
MKVVRCPRCGHENRAAISLSICDRCGADISTATDLNARSDNRDLRLKPTEVVVEPIPAASQEPPPPAPTPVAPPRPKEPLGRRVVAFIGRALLAAAAIAGGVAGGLWLRLGTALDSDPQLAGSIAILAAASAISGLVLILIGGSPDRSQSVTWGLRSVGFLLATLGVWAVTVIAQGALSDYQPGDSVDRVTPQMMGPGPMGGPGMMGPGGSGPGAPPSASAPGPAGPAPAPSAYEG